MLEHCASDGYERPIHFRQRFAVAAFDCSAVRSVKSKMVVEEEINTSSI